MTKRWLLFLFLIGCFSSLWATHNRAGEIIYRHISGLTYEFEIVTYTDPTSPADRDSLTIVFNSLDPVNNSKVIARTTETPINAGIKKNTYVTTHTYSGPGTYVVYMEDRNRVDNIVNINGSVNVPFYIEDTLFYLDPILFGFNSSPVLDNPPIDFAEVGEIFIHNPAAYDPDGDSLTFELIVPKEGPNLDTDYEFPDVHDAGVCPLSTMTIDRFTGELIWDEPCQIGIYNIAILISEYRDGRKIGTMIRDMQIFVEDTDNSPPELVEVIDTCIVAGTTLNINVTATDADGDVITLSATGGPFLVDNSPAIFTETAAAGTVSQTFSWNTNCSHVRRTFYQVVFKAEDDFSIGGIDIPLVDLQSWLITVVGPAPENLTTEATGNQIELTWDSLYTCFDTENFQGFSVWRKVGCDSTETFGNCQRGLEGTDYVKIADVDSNHHYTDFDVVRGPIYSYRVVAEFAESPPNSPFLYNAVGSEPSNLSCAELKRDVPVFTNVDIDITDASNGEIFVAWTRPSPIDLDTIENPGPYRFDLYRNPGFSPGSPTLVATFSSPNFADYMDTTFQDVGLNTVDGPFTYELEFFASNTSGDPIFIGNAEPASSVFLDIGVADNQLNLDWNEVVPWDNFEYVVRRETSPGSGTFDILDTVSVSEYTDDSLNNGSEYCYYIESIGRYGSVALPDTFYNNSQYRCAVPEDLEPSCPPTLGVTNICDQGADVPFSIDDLQNDLSWNNPNLTCADDVLSYNIYYAPGESGNLELIAQVSDPNDTTWIHDNLQSIAGCYAVTAIDSVGNESEFSNVVCVDNCPLYILPNVFTPNNDGSNDLYTPILPFRFIDQVDMKVYNRWGGLVFETSDPMLNWNGKDMNGRDLNEGTYYYVCNLFELRVEGVVPAEQSLSGYIHLIRGNGGTNP